MIIRFNFRFISRNLNYFWVSYEHFESVLFSQHPVKCSPRWLQFAATSSTVLQLKFKVTFAGEITERVNANTETNRSRKIGAATFRLFWGSRLGQDDGCPSKCWTAWFTFNSSFPAETSTEPPMETAAKYTEGELSCNGARDWSLLIAVVPLRLRGLFNVVVV